MEINSPTDRIVLSMWHRTRKEFVEWTSSEIRRRAKVSIDQHGTAVSRNLIKCTNPSSSRGVPHCYSITQEGMELVQKLRNEGAE